MKKMLTTALLGLSMFTAYAGGSTPQAGKQTITQIVIDGKTYVLQEQAGQPSSWSLIPGIPKTVVIAGGSLIAGAGVLYVLNSAFRKKVDKQFQRVQTNLQRMTTYMHERFNALSTQMQTGFTTVYHNQQEMAAGIEQNTALLQQVLAQQAAVNGAPIATAPVQPLQLHNPVTATAQAAAPALQPAVEGDGWFSTLVNFFVLW